MEENDFLNVLLRNDENELRKFIFRFGKNRKPFSPVYFFKPEDESTKGENSDERRRINNE
jgi:hypothetical protein